MNSLNEKIIGAVVEKARRVCPDSLALVGVYGSARTGDGHARSDLDLLILIGDEEGRKLAKGFILEDAGIGYDLYCTTWPMLEDDAACRQAHLGRLMDAEIVYASGEAALARLNGLRERAAALLASEERYRRAAETVERLCGAYARAMAAETLGAMRAWAAWFISLGLDAVMLWNGRYFKRGVKRTFEELAGLDLPEGFVEDIGKIVRSRDAGELGGRLTALLRSVMKFTDRAGQKDPPSKQVLEGTYEEMFSNWRNKMPEAAARGDVFSSFMNMASFQFMLGEIAGETDIPEYNVMEAFDPDDLAGNAEAFDAALAEYLKEYEKLGMKPERYRNVDEFVREYLG
ncbi:MAG: nucleotidyltransferase domain-containing protein [Clostridia bacterium]|nr:nucleotidyltransferase domain-containing protein [Clostridia bacterium]